MRKLIARLLVVLIILVSTLPLAVFAANSGTPPPDKPYEKVVAESGNWYSEQLTYDGKANLVVGYVGQYEKYGTLSNMEFEIRESTVLKGIYLPFVSSASEPVTIQLKDGKGNVYKDLATEKVAVETLRRAVDSTLDTFEVPVNYIFAPNYDIVLPAGHYSMILSCFDGAVGTFLVKGVNASAYEKYKEELRKWEAANNPEISSADGKPQTLGNEEFSKLDLGNNQISEFENPPVKKPAAFLLDADYFIDEIIINTYREGAGALPGVIEIKNENGATVLSMQAYGGSLGDVANGIWKIAPNIVLPAGNYAIALSDPEVFSFDEAGEPLFYVKASIPPTVRYDFTGTYRINLDTYKKSTRMGSVSDNKSSFSLKDFELTILDKEGEIELIGKYEDMPFSQACKIIEETENTIIAHFNFAADLTKLPYKAKIGVNALVTLTKPEKGNAKISIEGAGTYERAATAEKGADYNTYSLLSNGVMKQKELPVYVMAALGKSGNAGNIPGPDSTAQAAAGILFPPLAGVVVHVLQELLKPKPKAKAVSSTMRDKDWYKKNNPNLSEEALAMAMLADAMGSTDNPDEGDAVSIGDNENPGGSDYVPPEGYEPEEPYEYEPEPEYEQEPDPDAESDAEPDTNPENETGKQKFSPESDDAAENGTENPEETPVPDEKSPAEISTEPEEMVLQTSANGATSRYVKDAATGEWVNSETGGVLDYEKYKDTAAKQFAEDKKFNDAEFDKISKGEDEHSQNLNAEMKKISDNEKWEAYKDDKYSKYGTDDPKTIDEILNSKAVMEKASFEKWQMIGNVNAVGEVGATVVGAVADTAVDGLSNVTPGGAYIKAGYKITKGIAGTMADKGVNTGSFVEGAIKGGADAATDLVDKAGFTNPYAKAATKAIASVAGESGGSAAGAAIRGGEENWKQAAAEGLVDGVFKAGVGAVTDGIVGDAPDIVVPKGSINILPAMKNVLVNKAAGTKIGSAMIDEFGVKPFAAQPIKDNIGQAFKDSQPKK